MALRIAHDVNSRWLADEPKACLQTRLVHGYRRAFRIAGEGPPLLLIHGIGDSSRTWEQVIPLLAREHLVIAPDLLGHGASDKPRADYSVAAYANGMRDLLAVLGVDTVTIVGPLVRRRCGDAVRLPVPGADRSARAGVDGRRRPRRDAGVARREHAVVGQLGLSALRLPFARLALNTAVSMLRRLDAGLGLDAVDLRRIIDALPDHTARSAFIRTLRSVVDWRGQSVTMLDRSYLAHTMPTMLMWGGRDSVLPVAHAHRAHAAMPGSRLEMFPDEGHFPFRTDPARFVGLVEDFIATTEPADWSDDEWRELLRSGRLGACAQDDPVGFTSALRDECERSAT